jgi:hypothetical protein
MIDVLRTARLVSVDVAAMLFRMAVADVAEPPSSATSEGLAAIAASCSRALARAGVELEVRGRERMGLEALKEEVVATFERDKRGS